MLKVRGDLGNETDSNVVNWTKGRDGESQEWEGYWYSAGVKV
jgi:hypothetical protein